MSKFFFYTQQTIYSALLASGTLNVTKNFIINLKFTKYCNENESKSINNPHNIVVAYDLLTNYLDANPKRPFGKSEYDTRVREYEQKNMLDKDIYLITCKQYIIEHMEVMELDKMGIHGQILDDWFSDIARLKQLHNQSYASVHHPSYAFFLYFCFCVFS